MMGAHTLTQYLIPALVRACSGEMVLIEFRTASGTAHGPEVLRPRSKKLRNGPVMDGWITF